MKGIVSPEYASVYTGVIAIVVESALPYALSGIALAAVFNNTDLSFGFSTAWAGLAVRAFLLRNIPSSEKFLVSNAIPGNLPAAHHSASVNGSRMVQEHVDTGYNGDYEIQASTF